MITAEIDLAVLQRLDIKCNIRPEVWSVLLKNEVAKPASVVCACVLKQAFGHLEDVSKLKERKVVGYKCKFCVEVHPTLRAICNHLRKHVQYGNVSSVSATVKVRIPERD